MTKFTHRKKLVYYPIVVERDGYKCPYCPEPFTSTNHPEWEHYNNNPEDNRVENLTLVHHSCNNRKKFETDLQITANENLEKNEKAVLVRGNTLADAGTTKELTSQQEINKINTRITEQFLLEHTVNDEELILKDVVNAIVDICQKNNHTGSQSAVYRYIDYLTNPYTGRYTLSNNPQGKTTIRRRTEN